LKKLKMLKTLLKMLKHKKPSSFGGR